MVLSTKWIPFVCRFTNGCIRSGRSFIKSAILQMKLREMQWKSKQKALRCKLHVRNCMLAECILGNFSSLYFSMKEESMKVCEHMFC